MRVGLLFGMTGGGQRGCDVADAILFPPRGIQAGNHPKYIIFFQRLPTVGKVFQRLPTVAGGCQSVVMVANATVAIAGHGLRAVANRSQRLPRVANGWQRLPTVVFPRGPPRIFIDFSLFFLGGALDFH